MPEETAGATDAATATDDTATATVAQPIPLVDSEGKLTEKWRESLPEDIRGEAVFDRAKDFHGICRSLASAEKMVGKDKMVIPNEHSGEEEWDNYHRIAGWPEKPEDYGIARAEDYPEELYNEDYAKAATELFHKIRLTKSQAKALHEFQANTTLQAVKDKATTDEFEMDKLKTGLHTDWGAAYDQKLHLNNLAVEKGVEGDEEFKARLLEKFGNDPDFIKYNAFHGAGYAEHKGIVPTSTIISTPVELEAKRLEAMNHPAFLDPKHAQHKTQVELVTKLSKQIAEAREQKVVA